MALPALLAPAAKTIASAGLFEGARKGLPKLAGRAKSFIGNNFGRLGAAGGGGAVGFGLGNIQQKIQDRFGVGGSASTAILLLGALVVVVALGQLFDFNIDL